MSTNVTTPLGPVKTTTLYAVVTSDAVIQSGVGAVKATRLTEGIYKVTFNADVSLGCFTATASAASPERAGIVITVSLDGTDPATVVVYVFDTAGVAKNQGFFLNVTTAYGAKTMT